MNIDSHLKALRNKHATLEKEIHRQELSAHPDETKLMALKKQKLLIKDEIQRVTAKESHVPKSLPNLTLPSQIRIRH
jgi:hypothetical protein